MTPRLTRLTLALVASLGLSFATAAADLPDLGDSSANVLSAQAEREIGARTFAQLRDSGALLDDPEVNAYLQSLGHRLVASDPGIAALDFQFFAVSDSGINAFALPGGHIGVNAGLILATSNESELASVLAHEISHVTQKHIARQLEAQSGSRLAPTAAILAGIVAATQGSGEVANAAIAGATAGQASRELSYSRAHEREADRIGFELLKRAGFDAAAMGSFFTRMQQLTRLQEGHAPGYLRSHPLTHERIAEAQDRALATPYRQVPDSTEFLLVRALLQSYEGDATTALAAMRARSGVGSSVQQQAARYGLAAALLRSGDFAAASAEIAALDASDFRHPMVEALAGQILQRLGQREAALARYRNALERYPGHRQLVQDYPRALLDAGQAAAAARFCEQQLTLRRADPTLHLMAAEAHAALGRPLGTHYHQGEAYAAMDRLPEAVEQLQIALRSRGGDDITRQIAEARLRELRRQIDPRSTGRAGGAAPRPRDGGPLSGALPGFTPR